MDGNVGSPSPAKSTLSQQKQKQKHTISLPQHECMDCLSLRIVASTTPPVKVLRYSPMLVLHEDDASRLDVFAGDTVLLLAMDNDRETIERTAVARVHIGTNASTPLASPMATPTKKSPFSKSRRSNLTSGLCLVFPPALAHAFQSTTMVRSDVQLASPTLKTQTIEAPPKETSAHTPSKSKFSFAKGGGGDKLISNRSPSTPNPKPSTPRANHHTNLLWVVPVDSPLGDELLSLLCSKAGQLSLKPATFDHESSMPSSGEESLRLLGGILGQQLLQAHLVGSCLSNGTRLKVSVQGKFWDLEVDMAVEDHETKAHNMAAQLSGTMGDLSLVDQPLTFHERADGTGNGTIKTSYDKDGDSEEKNHVRLVAAAQQSANSPEIFEKCRLFEVLRSTRITLGPTDAKPKVSRPTTAPPKSLLSGCDATIEHVVSLLTTPLLHPELFQGKQALKPPRGVLVFGPSGVGKSTLAKQVGQHLEYYHNVHVQTISCAGLQSQTGLVGQAEKELVGAFETASQRRQGYIGGLILLDDVHLICRRRQGSDAGADRLSSTLLALLDGIDDAGTRSKAESYFPVVILATTSNPTSLDAALRRPGRLDTEVEMPLPDEPLVRSHILRFLLANFKAEIPSFTDDEWIALARLAKGFTGADMKLAVKEAIRSCVLEGRGVHPDAAGDEGFSYKVDKDMLTKAIRSIKPTSIKAVTVEIPKVHWTSIGGMEEVKQRLREAIELPMTHGAMFQALGIRPPKGVLLYGPPGCSKTLMARALATEGHMNFLAVKGPELLSKWLGESERALASLFRRARLASPSVIFFDEVDAIASKRGGGNSGGERLLSQLLTELDGVQSTDSSGKKQRVVVVCATNRPDLLDSALLRPGRIDRMIYVGVPDFESRRRILDIGLQGKACANDIDVSIMDNHRHAPLPSTHPGTFEAFKASRREPEWRLFGCRTCSCLSRRCIACTGRSRIFGKCEL